jgi:nucleoside-diphosphate-sugar epimerase
LNSVFLTGVTGFIGAHIARALLAEGVEVHALIRPDSDRWRIADIAEALHLIPGELSAPESFAAALRQARPAVCIHAAWDTTPGAYLNSPHNIDLVQASLTLARLLPEVGCARFVGLGTCIEQDTSFGHLSEATPLKPQTLYGASKASLYLMLQQMGLSFAWARIFQPYGPFERPGRLVPQVIASLHAGQPIDTTSGAQIRDFLHVQDIAGAVVTLARAEVQGAVNIGSGQGRSIRDALTLIGEHLNALPLIRFGARPQRPGEPPFIVANPARLQSELNWRPAMTFEQGIAQTIDWWLAYLKEHSP